MAATAPWAKRYGIVSGGSSGLGLSLVAALARQNAHVGIVGRDIGKLDKSRELALSLGASSVWTHSIDVTAAVPESEGARAFCESLENWLSGNRLSLLVNAVGRSDRGPLEKLVAADLESLFRDNVISHFNMTQLCLDSLKRGDVPDHVGTVINICSLAGIIATPNMGGYTVTKWALTGLTRQWRQELAVDGVRMTLVCPGPIRREDSDVRYVEVAKARGMSEQNAKPGGGANLKLLDADQVALQVLDAASRGKLELVMPIKATLLATIASFWPTMADRLLSRYIKK